MDGQDEYEEDDRGSPPVAEALRSMPALPEGPRCRLRCKSGVTAAE